MIKIFLSLVIILLTISSLNGAIIHEFGNIINRADRIKRAVYKKNTGLYREFSKNSAKDMVILADFFEVGRRMNSFAFLYKQTRTIQEIAVATQLDKLHYDLIIFTDIFTDSVYYILQEKNNKETYGWGTYIFNPEYTYDVLIECPHPLFDWGSTIIGINIFQKTNSKAFFMAGAHRNANGKKKGNLYGNSDAAHRKLSVFQAMHIAWTDSKTSTYQIHGYKSGKYNDLFPQTTDFVLSSSKGDVTKEVLVLNSSLKKIAKENNFIIHSQVANELPAFSYTNITVNRKSPFSVIENNEDIVYDGESFNELAGNDNRQGKYSNTYAKSPFVHVEIGSNLRRLISISSNIEFIVISSFERAIYTTAFKRIPY